MFKTTYDPNHIHSFILLALGIFLKLKTSTFGILVALHQLVEGPTSYSSHTCTTGGEPSPKPEVKSAKDRASLCKKKSTCFRPEQSKPKNN